MIGARPVRAGLALLGVPAAFVRGGDRRWEAT